jgi:hypothetical protein
MSENTNAPDEYDAMPPTWRDWLKERLKDLSDRASLQLGRAQQCESAAAQWRRHYNATLELMANLAELVGAAGQPINRLLGCPAASHNPGELDPDDCFIPSDAARACEEGSADDAVQG